MLSYMPFTVRQCHFICLVSWREIVCMFVHSVCKIPEQRVHLTTDPSAWGDVKVLDGGKFSGYKQIQWDCRLQQKSRKIKSKQVTENGEWWWWRNPYLANGCMHVPFLPLSIVCFILDLHPVRWFSEQSVIWVNSFPVYHFILHMHAKG